MKTAEMDSFSGCDVCGEEHETKNCPHLQNVKQVENAQAPSRAQLTLPSNLMIKKLKNSAFTVIVRENISTGTRFGPFDAQVMYDAAPKTKFPLKIFDKNGESYYLDSSNEEECNWMFFVLAAKTRNEQNLMAYQLGQDIYFSALRDIQIDEELKVWYAPHYAKKMAIEPPWPPVDPECREQLRTSSPAPKKVAREVPAQESQQPLMTRGMKRKISKDSVHTPDDPELLKPRAKPTEKVVFNIQAQKSVEPSRTKGPKRKIFKEFVETSDLDDQDDASQDLPSTREPPKTLSDKLASVNIDDSEFQSCIDFVRHLRQLYGPHKLEENGKQKEIADARSKTFDCQFCHDKFSSSKLLQRHHSRLHRGQIDATTTVANNPDSHNQGSVVAAQCDEDNDTEKVKNVEITSRHISDTDAASILLEIEANVDKPDGVLENSSNKETTGSVPMTVIAENAIESSNAVEQFHYITEIHYEGSGETHNADPSEHASMEGHIAMDSVMEEVTVNAVHDLADEMIYPQTCVSPQTKDDAEDSPAEHFCHLCKKAFTTKQSLCRHMTRHTRKFSCDDCGKSYCTRTVLNSHVCRKKPAEKHNYSCEICHKTFSRESYLEKHIPVHTGSHACPNCGKWLRSNTTLNNHIRVCSEVNKAEMNVPATCQECKKVFTDSLAFRRHMYDHTHSLICTKCGARFVNQIGKQQHLCLAQRAVKCDICDEEFPIVAMLNKHKESRGKDKIKCIACGRTFHQKEELSNHQCKEKVPKRSVQQILPLPKIQPLACDVCGLTYSSKSGLNTHKQLHGEKLISCELCDMRFYRRDLMLAHLAKHNEANIPCPTCDKMFKSKKTLDVHMLTHNGIKRFACNTCGKKFLYKNMLAKHEEVHNPDRKHCCSFCGKNFSTKVYLARHVLEHTQGRVHTCDICDKGFVKECQLRAHHREFHTNFSYICSFCGLSIKYKRSLRWHLRCKHPEQRCNWNNKAQISAMQVIHAVKEEDRGKNAESSQLEDTIKQVQDGTVVLLAVVDIDSETLRQSMVSGTTKSIPSTIEISSPAEDKTVDSGFVSHLLEGENKIQTPLDNAEVICETVGIIEQVDIENTPNDESVEMQIMMLHGEELF